MLHGQRTVSCVNTSFMTMELMPVALEPPFSISFRETKVLCSRNHASKRSRFSSALIPFFPMAIYFERASAGCG